VDTRHHGQRDGEDEQAVDQAEEHPEPPGEPVRGVKAGHVDDRERPPVQEVQRRPVDLGPIAVGREHRAEHVRDVHAREPHALAARHHRRQHGGRGEAP
jgi:hypothetical protein